MTGPALLALLELLTAADHRLVRTVDSLPVGAYAVPSGLPGWTRGHVVAHLALNAEALTAVPPTSTSWRPLDVAMFLMASLVGRPAEDGSFAVAPTEIGDTWQGGPSSAVRVVSGAAADLGGG